MTIPSGKLVATSKTSGTFLTKDNKRYNFSYDNESNTLFVEAGSDSLSYSLNYDDKGPGFINRVKGAVFGDKTYVFDDTGTTFEYDGYTYTWVGSSKDNEHYTGKDGKKYVYTKYKGGFWNVVYFVDLQDEGDKKDHVIMFQTSSTGAADYGSSIMGHKAYRTK